MKDSDKDMCVEENDEIPDKADLNVIFLSSMSKSILSLLPYKISTNQEILPMDVKVLYTESIIIEKHVDTGTAVILINVIYSLMQLMQSYYTNISCNFKMYR